MLEWFPRLIMLLVAVIVIVMLVRFFAYREVDASELHRASYAYRLYYDNDLLAYRDPVTGRAYPGVVDYARLTERLLDEGYGITGRISSAVTVTGACVETRTVYHDKATYDQFIGFARFGTLGPGGATMEERLTPITIIDGSERCAGTLNITIVRPNS